jgi:hypothetical protein
MGTYIIFSKFLPGDKLSSLPDRSKRVGEAIRQGAPGLLERWGARYALFSEDVDLIDIVESESLQEVQQAVAHITEHGHARAWIAAATEWRDYLAKL